MRSLIVLMTALTLATQASAKSGLDPADPTELAGMKLYDALCADCHGQYGRGDGPAAADLELALPDFTLPATLEGKSDDDIMRHLMANLDEAAKRHSPMPMVELLHDEDKLATVAYIRTMAVPGRHVSVRAGRDLYNGICWICHGVTGDGQGPAVEKLGEAKPRDFTASDFEIDGREDEVYRVISTGAENAIHGSKYMIEWSSKLTPQQINDIIEYLRSF